MVLLSTAIIGLLVIVGVALLAIGLRGRRIDDHPLCRRCGYDLTGGGSVGRCPECGADLARRRAVRVGHRARQSGLVVMGIVLLLPSAAALAVGSVARARGVDPTPFKPAWWLRRDLNGGPALRDRALAELTARVAVGRLPPAQTTAVADRALAAQLVAPWDPAWGTFLEAAHAAGHLNRPRWATYARQGVELSLKFGRYLVAVPDNQVFKGEMFYVAFDNQPRPATTGWFRAVFDMSDLQIDGRPVRKADTFEIHSSTDGRIPLELVRDTWAPAPYLTFFRGRRFAAEMTGPSVYIGGWTPILNQAFSGNLRTGFHTVKMTLHAYLYDGADMANFRRYHGKPMAMPDGSKLLSGFDVEASGSFQVGTRASVGTGLSSSPGGR